MKKNPAFAIAVCFIASMRTEAQRPYSIDVSRTVSKTIQVPLELGGSNPQGGTINVNNDFILVNGQPFFPVMGEFHFSRYPHEYWEESILKMKAGGINTIATYVFWILHEPREGGFDWSGDRNLREFASLCAKHNMWLIVRIGPYGHGEIRNGAIPDWLYGRPINIRSDDPAYLALVKPYFSAIAMQLKGKLYKDGGTVIGIQLENEYQHAGSTWWLNYPGSPSQYTFPYSQQTLTKANTYNVEKKELYKATGDQHMLTLKKIAKDSGLDVPLYTTTGWGYAAIADKASLPVSAAYAYPSWGNLEPSPFYLFKDLKTEPDYGPVRYNSLQYPALSAEIGSGIMVTNSKRPLVPANSITPLMIRNIGSGCNGIGYYMYHGGSTPVQEGQFMSEEAGELPKISYDFQAPVGEYGQVRSSYKQLVPLHLFLASYGSMLAPMPVTIPQTNPVNPSDSASLRYSVRSDGNSGFIFIHNYQDHVNNIDLDGLQLSVQTKKELIKIPAQGSFSLKKQVSAILPFNLKLDDILIKYSTAQPLTNFTRAGVRYHVFISIDGLKPEFYIKSKTKITAGQNGQLNKKREAVIITGNSNSIFSFSAGKNEFLVIPMFMAVNAYKLDSGLLFTSQAALINEDGLDLISHGAVVDTILFYPAQSNVPLVSGAALKSIPFPTVNFSAFEIDFTVKKINADIEKPTERNAVIRVDPAELQDLNDLYMEVDYAGDKAQAFLDGKLIADHFYYGAPWEIGLKRFYKNLKSKPIYLYFHPLVPGAACLEYLAGKIPSLSNKKEYLKINSIHFIPEYKCRLTMLR